MGVRHFSDGLVIDKGDVVGLQFSTRGPRERDQLSRGTRLESWIPPLAAEQRPSTNDTEYDYQLLYNAVIERDADGDGLGDATQDDCPKDPGLAKGLLSGRKGDCSE